MSELLYKDECFQLVGCCMEIHRELDRGLDEVVQKDALVHELSRADIPFTRERKCESSSACRSTSAPPPWNGNE